MGDKHKVSRPTSRSTIHRGLAFGVWSLVPSPEHTEGPWLHLLSGSIQSSVCLCLPTCSPEAQTLFLRSGLL